MVAAVRQFVRMLMNRLLATPCIPELLPVIVLTKPEH